MLAPRRTYGRQREITPQHSEEEEHDTPPTSQHSVVDYVTRKAKIASLLAELETDEEHEPHEGITNRSREGHITTCSSPSTTPATKSLPSVAQIMQDDDEQDGDDEEESAYDRMRRTLFTKTASTKPASPVSTETDAEDSDIGLPRTAAAIQMSVSTVTPKRKLQVLAERKRQQHETEEQIRNEARAKTKLVESDSDSEDIEAEMRMSSARRVPRRAATKKAIEEMHRETERIARSMTLAPNAQVKTKLKMDDFLSKIGYLKPQVDSPNTLEHSLPDQPASLADPLVNEKAASVDAVSPTTLAEMPVSAPFAKELEESDSDIELPNVAEIVSSQPSVMPVTAELPETAFIHEDVLLDSDSNSEEELPGHLRSHKLLFKKRDFEQIKRDQRAAKFVAMARPDSPTKLEARAEKARRHALLAQVSIQAKSEREAREAALRAAGVTIMTAEQRQKEALDVEDLVEKARRQAAELRKLEEKEDRAKKAAEEGVNGSSEEEEDHDWQADVEYSGDESDVKTDEDNGEAVSDSDEGEENLRAETAQPILGRTVSVLSERQISDDEDHILPVVRIQARKSRAARVLGDDDDSEEDKENARPESLHEYAETGLTQFFEATQIPDGPGHLRDFSASQFVDDSAHETFDSMRQFDNIDGERSPHRLISRTEEIQNQSEQADFVPSSQINGPYDEPIASETQFSLYDPPSPDYGVLPLPSTLRTDYTQATEVDHTQLWHKEDSVVDPPRNRLHRMETSPSATSPGLINAFKRMRQAMDEEQHRKSRRAFVDDRAIESDDEYAGLGGASDEEPEDAAEVAAELADMIDHDAQDEDEEGQSKIAAFYAQRDLENDEKLVNTLMNDINNGGLRRKRGAGLLDMDDSEDEEEEKARYKARQAQMRARLLESQNLTSLADNPKTRAFIEALEDRPTSAHFIEIAGEEDAFVPETQQEVTNPVPVLERADTLVDDSQASMAPPLRPYKKSGKRKTQSEIHEELSFLRDEDESFQDKEDFDPAFVPTLKRERSSLTIEDRSCLSRENSQTWRDPRQSGPSQESLYAQLAASRTAQTTGAMAPVTVVVSNGHQMASRMATKAVNYHAKAAQAMRATREKEKTQVKRIPRGHDAATAGASKKREVLKLFA